MGSRDDGAESTAAEDGAESASTESTGGRRDDYVGEGLRREPVYLEERTIKWDGRPRTMINDEGISGCNPVKCSAVTIAEKCSAVTGTCLFLFIQVGWP